MTLPVFEEVFEGGRGENKEKRKDRDLLVEGVDGRNPVEDDNEEKVDVCHPVELFKEVFWEECQGSVLGGGHLVTGVLAGLTTVQNHNPLICSSHSSHPPLYEFRPLR